MTSRRAVVLFATVLELAASSSARAEPPPAAPDTVSRHFVDLVIAGDPEEAGAAERSLRELLRRVGLDLRVTTVDRLPVERGAPAADAEVCAWIDLRSDNGALVEVADARAERTFERRVVAQEGSRAVLIEDVAHVVQAAAESIASGAPPPSPPPAAPTPPVATIAPPPVQAPYVPRDTTPLRAESTPWSLAVAGFFTTAPYAHESGAVLGAGAGVRFDAGRFAMWAFGAYHAKFGEDAPPVALHASVWSVRLVPTFELVDASGFLLEAGAGAGVDIFSISPGATSSDVAMLDANRTEASPILTALVAAHVRLGSNARAFLAGTLDWDLDPRRYVLAPTGASSPLLTPLTVRPGVSLGLSFDVVRVEARR